MNYQTHRPAVAIFRDSGYLDDEAFMDGAHQLQVLDESDQHHEA